MTAPVYAEICDHTLISILHRIFKSLSSAAECNVRDVFIIIMITRKAAGFKSLRL